MKNILLLNTIVELTGGIIVILFPDLLLFQVPMENLSFNISKMYGIAASLIGLFSYLTYRYGNSPPLIKYTSLAIIAFHMILAFQLYGMYSIALVHHQGPFLFHLIIAVVSGILYLKHMGKNRI